jgi:phage-related protein
MACDVSDDDAIVILDVFAKKSAKTPKAVVATCSKRLKEYDHAGK